MMEGTGIRVGALFDSKEAQMGKQAKQAFIVSDEHGTQHRFEAGDEVPDELVKRVDNPAVWESSHVVDPQEGEVGIRSAPQPVSTVVQDAPWAVPTDERPDVVTPQSGRPVTTEAGLSEATDGELSDPSEAGRTVPSAGELDGMTRADLDGVAASLGLSTQGMRKDEVRAAIESHRASGS